MRLWASLHSSRTRAEFFFPDAAPFRLMNAQARAHRLDMLGVERLYETAVRQHAVANFRHRDFAVQVLHDGLGIRHVVIGCGISALARGAPGDSRRFAGPRQ